MSPFPPPINITFLPDQIFPPGGSAARGDTRDPGARSGRPAGAWLCRGTGRRCCGTAGKAQRRRLRGGGKGLIRRRPPGDALRRGTGVRGTAPGTGHPTAGQSARCRDGGSWNRSVLVLSCPGHRTATDLRSERDRSCHHLLPADFGFMSLRCHRADNRPDRPHPGVTGTSPRNGVLQRSHRAPVPPAVTARGQLRRSSRYPNAGAAGTDPARTAPKAVPKERRPGRDPSSRRRRGRRRAHPGAERCRCSDTLS